MDDIEIDLERLAEALPEMRRRAEERAVSARAPGELARLYGKPISADPNAAGAWTSTRWLEGWSGTRAPERGITLGQGFNMTPTEEFYARYEWLLNIGVEPARVREAMVEFRKSYRDETLPAEH